MSTVTAAITTYNRAGLVGAALDSVLAQTRQPEEIVVVDDGSSDATAEVLARYGDRIRYVFQDNSGRAGARNRALAEASGAYIAFLDSDDRWRPDKLERQLPMLDRSSRVAFVHGHVDVIDGQGRSDPAASAYHHALFSAANRPPRGYADYARESRCLTSTVLARAEVLRELGGFDPAIEVEDVDLYLRVAISHEIAFLDGAALAEYRIHDGQTDNDELTRGLIALCRKHLGLIAAGAPIADARIARRNLELELARCYSLRGDGGGVRAATVRALRLDPAAIALPRVARQLALSFAPAAARRRLRSWRGHPTQRRARAS